ncbi:hypothetical protein ACSV5M_06205 [Cellvibrio sp. ARAG 10.3]|uniref:hypothetical protein n=1 Tax=Cellvibrio sp. ARAG 10.3 TaxID=3451358 RepID=UPI003F46DA20
MTSRTQSHYTPSQIIDRCARITLDDLLSRGSNVRNPMFKHLAGFMHSTTVGAHLLEWPDGTLVLVISRRASEFSQLTAEVITAAYRWAANGHGLIYRDTGGECRGQHAVI